MQLRGRQPTPPAENINLARHGKGSEDTSDGCRSEKRKGGQSLKTINRGKSIVRQTKFFKGSDTLAVCLFINGDLYSNNISPFVNFLVERQFIIVSTDGIQLSVSTLACRQVRVSLCRYRGRISQA